MNHQPWEPPPVTCRLTTLLLVGLLLALTALDPAFAAPSARASIALFTPRPGDEKRLVLATLPDDTQGFLLIDTGADRTVIAEGIAARLGIPVARDAGWIAGIDAQHPVGTATLPSLRLGRVALDQVDVLVGLPSGLRNLDGVPLAGILGNDVLSRFVLAIDDGAGRLQLLPPGRARLPARAAPLSFDGRHVSTLVQLATRAHPEAPVAVSLTLDTGAEGVTLQGEAGGLFDGEYTTGVEEVRGLGSAVAGARLRPTRRIPLVRVTLGGHTRPFEDDVRWLQPAEGDTGRLGGLAGFALLAGRRAVIDYRGGRFLLARTGRRSGPQDARAAALSLEAPHWGNDVAVSATLDVSLGNTAAAAARLDRGLANAPDAYDLRAIAAQVALRDGATARARDLLRPIPAGAAVDAGVAIQTVGLRAAAGDIDGARRLAEGAVAVRPGAAIAWAALADARLAAGDADGAQAALRDAVARARDPDAWLLRRARVADARGDGDAAHALLRRALDANPLDGRPLRLLAHLATDDDARDALRAEVAAVIARTHPALRPYGFVAFAQSALGDTAAARAARDAGTARDCGVAADDLALCEAWYAGAARDASSTALARLARATRASAPSPTAEDARAMLHAAASDPTAAAAAARRAALLAPGDPYLAWLAARAAIAATPPAR